MPWIRDWGSRFIGIGKSRRLSSDENKVGLKEQANTKHRVGRAKN